LNDFEYAELGADGRLMPDRGALWPYVDDLEYAEFWSLLWYARPDLGVSKDGDAILTLSFKSLDILEKPSCSSMYCGKGKQETPQTFIFQIQP